MKPKPAPVFSTETAKTLNKPLPMPVPFGAINQFMRLQARAEARDIALTLRGKLRDPKGVSEVIETLKRAAIDRPGSVVRGFLDVIEFLQEHST